MQVACRVLEGAEMPRGYGFAYWDYPGWDAVCYPVPLNLCVKGVRWVWARLRRGWYDARLAAAWCRGRDDGLELGYMKAMRDMDRQGKATLERVRAGMAAGEERR